MEDGTVAILCVEDGDNSSYVTLALIYQINFYNLVKTAVFLMKCNSVQTEHFFSK